MRREDTGSGARARRTGGAVTAGAYEAITVTDGGSLTGTVKYAGTPPGAGEVRRDEGQRGRAAQEKTEARS